MPQDMLVVGMPIDRNLTSLTRIQWKTHFSLWSISAAPLWIGVDMTSLPSGALEILSNPGVVAVDQDPAGHAATCFSPGGCPHGNAVRYAERSQSSTAAQVFARNLAPVPHTGKKRMAAVLFNPSELGPVAGRVDFNTLGFENSVDVEYTDLWAMPAHAKYGLGKGHGKSYSTAAIGPLDCVMLLLEEV